MGELSIVDKSVQIRNIYAGKPDAKDEIEAEGLESFLSSFIAPINIDINSLVDGTECFITGYKGTGKTALQCYLDSYIREKDAATCSSFVFFKGDYSDTQKQEMEVLSKRITSSISIGNDVVIEGNDFEYIWRWIFYQRIVEDNVEFCDGLFEDSTVWREFCAELSKIQSTNGKKKLAIPRKIKFSIPITDMQSGIIYEPGMELDFSENNIENNCAYVKFVEIIDRLDELFPILTRTDIPYYIFVDELEAYYGEKSVFMRDLRLIRDLVFTVKKLNAIVSVSSSTKTKIICSVRTEILNSISRFVVTKELNKVISGYEIPLAWDYTNTNSFEHPILKILLRRISMAEEIQGNNLSDRDIVEKWFPEKIHSSDPANYILNRSWCKPRDIVRFILSARACLCSTYNSFSQATFDMLQKQYSADSLKEIREEMLALYTSEQIENIITCLTGFRVVFTFEEIAIRIEKYYKGSIWDRNLASILNDIYRLGIIGNYSEASESYRWQHRGNDGLILSSEWSMMIHPALQNALSVSKKHDYGIKTKNGNSLETGDSVSATVYRIVPGYLLVQFSKNGSKYRGSIHISELSNGYIDNIFSFAKLGQVVQAQVLEYDAAYKQWKLTLKLI